MKTQRTFCVSHEPPLAPESLYDYAIGIGDYRPARGSHISALNTFWDRMRPFAYGAAGNYAIPRAIEREAERTELTGIFSHRKIVVRSPIGNTAKSYPVYREISVAESLCIPIEETRPKEDCDFLFSMPLQFPRGILHQYGVHHHAIDISEYISIAVRLGIIASSEVEAFCTSATFIPGGCELGIYPTPWLCDTLKKLEAVGREFVILRADRIQTYDAYQVRAVGFLAERLGSYLLLKELQNRFPQGIPRSLIGYLCVVVPDGSAYAGATVPGAAA
jgi:hypothetical protein